MTLFTKSSERYRLTASLCNDGSMTTNPIHYQPYQKLIVWKEAHVLCRNIYQLTLQFPSYEKFALANQMRKSSYSVPTNIAEGTGKKSLKERDHFFEHSSCSLEELHYQCYLAKDLSYITEQEFTEVEGKIRQVSYLLMRLRNSLKV